MNSIPIWVQNKSATAGTDVVTVGVKVNKGEVTSTSHNLRVIGATFLPGHVQWVSKGVRYDDGSYKYLKCSFLCDLGASGEKQVTIEDGVAADAPNFDWSAVETAIAATTFAVNVNGGGLGVNLDAVPAVEAAGAKDVLRFHQAVNRLNAPDNNFVFWIAYEVHSTLAHVDFWVGISNSYAVTGIGTSPFPNNGQNVMATDLEFEVLGPLGSQFFIYGENKKADIVARAGPSVKWTCVDISLGAPAREREKFPEAMLWMAHGVMTFDASDSSVRAQHSKMRGMAMDWPEKGFPVYNVVPDYPRYVPNRADGIARLKAEEPDLEGYPSNNDNLFDSAIVMRPNVSDGGDTALAFRILGGWSTLLTGHPSWIDVTLRDCYQHGNRCFAYSYADGSQFQAALENQPLADPRIKHHFWFGAQHLIGDGSGVNNYMGMTVPRSDSNNPKTAALSFWSGWDYQRWGMKYEWLAMFCTWDRGLVYLFNFLREMWIGSNWSDDHNEFMRVFRGGRDIGRGVLDVGAYFLEAYGTPDLRERLEDRVRIAWEGNSTKDQDQGSYDPRRIQGTFYSENFWIVPKHWVPWQEGMALMGFVGAANVLTGEASRRSLRIARRLAGSLIKYGFLDYRPGRSDAVIKIGQTSTPNVLKGAAGRTAYNGTLVTQAFTGAQGTLWWADNTGANSFTLHLHSSNLIQFQVGQPIALFDSVTATVVETPNSFYGLTASYVDPTTWAQPTDPAFFYVTYVTGGDVWYPYNRLPYDAFTKWQVCACTVAIEAANEGFYVSDDRQVDLNIEIRDLAQLILSDSLERFAGDPGNGKWNDYYEYVAIGTGVPDEPPPQPAYELPEIIAGTEIPFSNGVITLNFVQPEVAEPPVGMRLKSIERGNMTWNVGTLSVATNPILDGRLWEVVMRLDDGNHTAVTLSPTQAASFEWFNATTTYNGVQSMEMIWHKIPVPGSRDNDLVTVRLLCQVPEGSDVAKWYGWITRNRGTSSIIDKFTYPILAVTGPAAIVGPDNNLEAQKRSRLLIPSSFISASGTGRTNADLYSRCLTGLSTTMNHPSGPNPQNLQFSAIAAMNSADANSYRNILLFGSQDTVGLDKTFEYRGFNASGTAILRMAHTAISAQTPSTGYAGSRIQRVKITGATGGDFTLLYRGRATVPIAWNAHSDVVREALTAALLGEMNGLMVGGGNGGPYLIFLNPSDGVNSPITADVSKLTGSDIAATTEHVDSIEEFDDSMNLERVYGNTHIPRYPALTGAMVAKTDVFWFDVCQWYRGLLASEGMMPKRLDDPSNTDVSLVARSPSLWTAVGQNTSSGTPAKNYAGRFLEIAKAVKLAMSNPEVTPAKQVAHTQTIHSVAVGSGTPAYPMEDNSLPGLPEVVTDAANNGISLTCYTDYGAVNPVNRGPRVYPIASTALVQDGVTALNMLQPSCHHGSTEDREWFLSLHGEFAQIGMNGSYMDLLAGTGSKTQWSTTKLNQTLVSQSVIPAGNTSLYMLGKIDTARQLRGRYKDFVGLWGESPEEPLSWSQVVDLCQNGYHLIPHAHALSETTAYPWMAGITNNPEASRDPNPPLYQAVYHGYSSVFRFHMPFMVTALNSATPWHDGTGLTTGVSATELRDAHCMMAAAAFASGQNPGAGFLYFTDLNVGADDQLVQRKETQEVFLNDRYDPAGAGLAVMNFIKEMFRSLTPTRGLPAIVGEMQYPPQVDVAFSAKTSNPLVPYATKIKPQYNTYCQPLFYDPADGIWASAYAANDVLNVFSAMWSYPDANPRMLLSLVNWSNATSAWRAAVTASHYLGAAKMTFYERPISGPRVLLGSLTGSGTIGTAGATVTIPQIPARSVYMIEVELE